MSDTNDINNIIKKVLQCFEAKINSKKINVYIAYKKILNQNFKGDWHSYELILFNLVQNAIKYNHENGDIFIIVQCKMKKPNIMINDDQIVDR